MKKHTQSGFSLVVILLVLILVAVVGFAGYYVYNTQQNKKDTASQPATDKKLTSANPAATPAAPTAQDTQKYLVIKEWGVKVPLAKNIEDATYYYRAFEDGGSAVYVSTKTISAKYPDCAADKTTVYAYGRFNNPNERNELVDKTMGELNPNAPKVGNYYYYAIHPQAYCFETLNKTDKEIDAIQKNEIQPLMDSFVEAIKKVQAQ